MKKLLIVTLMLLFVITGIAYAEPSDSEVVSAFKQYVSDEVTRAIASYEPGSYQVKQHVITSVSSNGTKKTIVWRKGIDELHPKYTIDVKKNNSLISPYIGTMEIEKTYYAYEDCPTKEEAEKSTKEMWRNKYKCRFELAYQDNKWVVTKVVFDNCERETMGIYDALKSR